MSRKAARNSFLSRGRTFLPSGEESEGSVVVRYETYRRIVGRPGRESPKGSGETGAAGRTTPLARNPKSQRSSSSFEERRAAQL